MELELVACLLHSFVFLNSYACVVPNMYVGSLTTAFSCTFWPPWTPVQEYARMCMYTRIHTEIFFIFLNYLYYFYCMNVLMFVLPCVCLVPVEVREDY